MVWKYFEYFCWKENLIFILRNVIFLGMVHGIICRKVTIVPVREDISAPLLSCWTCSHSAKLPNEDCIKLSNKENITKTECKLYEPFCKVQMLEAEGKVEKIERSCATDCDSGCHRYQSVKRCDSCCTQPLCNDGNNASTMTKQKPLNLTIFATFIFIASYMIHG